MIFSISLVNVNMERIWKWNQNQKSWKRYILLIPTHCTEKIARLCPSALYNIIMPSLYCNRYIAFIILHTLQCKHCIMFTYIAFYIAFIASNSFHCFCYIVPITLHLFHCIQYFVFITLHSLYCIHSIAFVYTFD